MKETPADAQVASHRLMMRAGMIRKVAAGIYNYLPLGWRVFEKVSKIVREELDAADTKEIHMPAVQPGELWSQSGRWEQYGPELLRFKDRKGGEFCFGPTHEEVVTSLVRDEVKSYRQLPMNLYQIQTKFRDEMRPRFGLMRGREFIMKDAYSLDIDDDGANASYDKMFRAYQRIFTRCGLTFRPVEADTGSIGGARSHEFQVLADTGEDAIVYNDAANYAANVELAEIGIGEVPSVPADAKAMEKVETPGKKTIADVASFLKVDEKDTIKAVLFVVDDKNVMALCRGDHDINEVKLKRALSAKDARMMTDKEIFDATGAPVGYVGPVNPKGNIRIVADNALLGRSAMVAGANEKNFHIANLAVGRDFDAEFFDLRPAVAGDLCARGGGVYEGARGIEVGHVFFLGTKYSEAMGCTVQNETGDDVPLVMGCYGIGITRTAAAAIEQNHDDDGILLPAPLAPFHVSLVQLGDDEETTAEAERIYAGLLAKGIEVLLDDRDERPGVKFKDHDLIGNPVRAAVGGRGLKDGIVEVKKRTEGRDGVRKVPLADAVDVIASLVAEEFAKIDAAMQALEAHGA